MARLKTYIGVGLMSGSSLDGLDMALCRFVLHPDQGVVEEWQLLQATTEGYTEEWVGRLSGLTEASAIELAATHTALGRLWSDMLQPFLAASDLRPDFIAAHGHTIFHHPEAQFSTQIGDGASLAYHTGIPVITDFRSMDIAAGGQGAPLAPLADRHLFPGYTHFLNLGGIANISIYEQEVWTAFDVAPANQLLNHLAHQLGQAFDIDGKTARSGKLLPELLALLEANPYYRQPFPKSLDNSWVRKEVLPLADRIAGAIPDKLHTATVFIARQIADSLALFKAAPGTAKLLVTGGGALNVFLIDCLKAVLPSRIEVSLPGPELIQFKEAALMALLGVLRMEGLPNSMRTVTGAARDTVGGALYWAGPGKSFL